VVSSSRDGTVKVWDLAPRPACTRLTHGLNHATVLGYDGLRIAYGSPLGFHDIASGKSVVEMEKGPAYVSAMALSHDGKRLAAVGPSGDDRSVYVWDAETGRRILLLEGHRAMPRSAAFSHDDRRIVSCGDGGEVRLWNAVTGEPLRSWQGYPRRLWSVEFSPDDGLIVGKANDDVVVLWDASTGLEHKRFGTPLGGTDSMVGRQYSGNATFHPGGRWIASGNHDGTITVLDSHSGESVRTLRGHTKQVYAVSFSPDGNRLASASDDGTLKLWDVAEGVNVLTLRDVEGPSYPTGTAPFYCVVFSRDGCRLAAASARSVLVWDPGGWDDNAATPVPQVTP
jgi:WD40 repeat protein